jgi:S-DNA-T family DNA segregation ATPase FtsK/SpoIIIE
MREVVVYASLFSGWIIWAGIRAFDRTKLLAKLRDAFLYCGLEINNKVPAFIEDVPIDDHVRNLKLFTQGLSVKKFTDSKDNLEAYLNISIDKMRDENGDKGRINILYAMRPLDTTALLDNVLGFADGEIPIGISYEGPITVNMRDVAHILAAGQTGGGKSNFEKVVTSVLVVNNRGAEVFYLDFKGGMELADLTNRLGEKYDNFHKYEGPKACAKFLSDLGEKIESRLKEIASSGSANLDDYLAKRAGENAEPKADDSGIVKEQDVLKRTYIVIDEIAQLYARDPSISREDLAKARDAVNRIARQGRAAGIHLIVATQKPDAQSFDQTVKANLPAVLCFPMPSQAASVSALGTKRAFDLNPEIKGRAIWKYGPTTTEVQTYLFQ